MTDQPLDFGGISPSDDVVYIPILSEILKILHQLMPTIIPPYLITHLVVIVIGTLLVMFCLYWSRKKCEEDLYKLERRFKEDEYKKMLIEKNKSEQEAQELLRRRE